jgi:PAS domain S-box-containing protein
MVAALRRAPDGVTDGDAWEKALEMWQAVGAAIPDILLLLDQNGTILYVNRVPPAFAEHELAGTSVFELAFGPSRNELAGALHTLLETGDEGVRTVKARHPDGAFHWYAIHTGPVRVAGRVVAAAMVARDVTDRKHMEDAVRDSEERYRTVVEHAPEAIVVFDVDQECFVEANRNACALFGLTRAELLRSNPVELSPETQPDGEASASVARRHIAAALAGGAPVFDWIHRTPCNVELTCEVRLVRLPSEGRRLVRGSITDVTRQRQLEEHVQQLHKIEALGQLAGGVAHDFNNLLWVISASVDLLADQLVEAGLPRPVWAAEVEEIRSAARRGTTLTAQLLAFARQRQPEPERFDLNPVVVDTVAMVRRLVPEGIQLVTVVDPAGVPVRAHRGRLEQVVMNLLLNARDAIARDGTITITTARLADSSVRLRVTDTGVGMSEETRKRVFEPLFTTKPPGKGTGLGLASVRAIVEQIGGRVEVTSELGKGSTFDVVLPPARGG